MTNITPLDYVVHQGRRVPYFKTKWEANEALKCGLIQGNDTIVIGGNSFQGRGDYTFADGSLASLGSKAARRVAPKAGKFAKKAAKAKQPATVRKLTQASRGGTKPPTVKPKTPTARPVPAPKPPVSPAIGQNASKAIVPAVIGLSVIGGANAAGSVVAKVKKSPEAKVEALPDGGYLVTYPDGSTERVDSNGKVRNESDAGGFKGAAEGVEGAAKGLALLAAIGLGGYVAIKAINSRKSSSGSAESAPAAKKPRAPASAKPMAA